MNSPIAMRDAYGWKFAFFHPPIHGFQFRQRKTVNMSSTQPNIFHVKGRKILRKWQKNSTLFICTNILCPATHCKISFISREHVSRVKTY